MVNVKHSVSTRRPISILANVPRDQSLSRGVTLGPRPPRAARSPKGKVTVGAIEIDQFDLGVSVRLRSSPDHPLDLTDAELDDLVVAIDRVLEGRVTKPSAPPRSTPPTRLTPHDAATAFKQANRALVKIG